VIGNPNPEFKKYLYNLVSKHGNQFAKIPKKIKAQNSDKSNLASTGIAVHEWQCS
jgi:hypothetical protein